MKPKSTIRLAFPLASAIAALLASSSVHAGQIWDGGSGTDNNWNTADNWDGNAIPTFTNAITFAGNVRNGAFNNLTADSIIGGINLTNDGTSGKTNAFTLSGARITLGGDITTTASAITDTISLNMILDGNRAITTNTNHSLIIGGIVSETGGAHDLAKNGAGTLRFDSINTYSGTTSINAGTVEVKAGTAGGSAVWGSGPLTLSQGATLYFNPTNQAIQNTSGFTVSGAIALSGGPGTTNIKFAGNDNKFALSGGVTGQAGVAQTFAITQGASITGGDRENILFTGAIADGSGGTLGASVDFAGGSSSSQNGFVNLKGQNTFTGNLTVTNSKGLKAGNTYPGAWLTIGGERYVGFSAPTTVSIGNGYLGTGADYSGNISISNGSGGLTTLGFLTTANQILRGGISGTGSLHQGGSGTLTLTNANTFSGTTTIATGAGTLIMENALALQNSPLGTGSASNSLTLFGTPTALQIGGLSGTSGSLGTIISGSAYNSISALTLNPQAGVSVTYGGVLANGAAGMTLTKTGAGTQTLSGANSFTGATTVSAGTLALDYTTQNNSKLSDSAALTLSGGTVSLSGGSHTEVVASTSLQAGTVSSITRSSGTPVLQMGTVTLNTGASLNLGAAGIATTNNTNNSLGVLGPWATIAGTEWAVNSTNGANGLITGATYTDVTRLSSGTKTIASGSVNYRIIEGTGTVGDVTMASAGATSINTLVNTATTAGTVDVGTGNTLSTGAILQGTGAGALTIGVSGATAGTLSALSPGGDLGVIVNSTNGVTINSVIADNSASTLTKDGTGTLTLTSANSYTGGTTVNAGTMIYASKSSFGTGTVNLAGGIILKKITEEGNSAGLAMANNISLSGGQVTLDVDFSVAKDQWFSGKISGPGSLRVIGGGGVGRAVTFTGNNDFTGGVLLDTTSPPAWIQLGNANGLGTGTLTVNATGGSAVQGLGASTNLTSGPGVPNNIVINSGATLNLGGNGASGNMLLSGIISGAGSLNKSGVLATTFTLSGANTYTGNTTVNTGTLVLADNAQLKFVLGATSGSNNSISGSGTVTLEGDFVIDTTAADALPSGTWTLENVASLAGAYGANFTVAGFTDAGGNKWTKPNGAKTYTFDETTGILTLAASNTYASWIAGFPGVGILNGVNDDPDNDGIDNGMEMVLGGNPATGMDTVLLPTIELVTNPVSVPAIPAGNYLLFTYRRSDLSVAAGVTADCETDTDLAGPWTAATGAPGVVIQVDDNYASFTPAATNTDRVRVYVPRGANTKLFGRLNVVVP